MQGIMKKGNHFNVPGSPLNGKTVPTDWNKLTVPGKKRALIKCGYFENWTTASKAFSKHVGAALKNRREWEKRMDDKRKGGK